MSRSIPELFASYARTKTAAFTNVWRRFCAHDILTGHGRGVVRILVAYSSCMWTGHSSALLHTTFAHTLWELRTNCARMVWGSIFATHSEKNFSERFFFDIRKSFACPVKTHLQGCFHGAREWFAKGANVEKLHSHLRLQKFAKHARGFGSVANCSRESLLVRREFQKSLSFCERFPRPGPWFARDLFSKCLKKIFVIIMRTTYSRRMWCSQNLPEAPGRFRQFGECFAHVSRKKRSSSDYLSTYSRTVRVLLLIRLPFATINFRMSRSIPELFASYTRTKTDAFTNVWRSFAHTTFSLWPK